MATSTTGFRTRSGEQWRDPWGDYRWLREHDPVHHVVDGDYWVLSRFEDVFSAARDTARFSSAQGLTHLYDDVAAAGLGEATPMVFMDPPEHTEFRRLVAKGFTPRQVAEVEPDVRRFVRERLDVVAEKGRCDIVAELLKPLPTYVVAHYLGVPEGDRGRFDDWVHRIVAASALGDPMIATDAVGEVFEYFGALIERRRHEPGDDTVSLLVHAADGAGVDPLRILGFAFTMITGGNDTTTGLLSVGLDVLQDEPGAVDTLVVSPERVDDAAQELLRLTSPVQGLARTTTVDVVMGGRVIPAGRKVLLLYASANRDERRFGDDAARYRLDRGAQQIMTFGYGAHHCLGASAARLMGRVVLEELLGRFPAYRVDPDAGRFAPGHFVRWYEHLPFDTGA
jgi:cytochrome P450